MTPEEIKKNYIRSIYENEDYKVVIDMINFELENFGTLDNEFTINLPYQIEDDAMYRIVLVYKYVNGWRDITYKVIKLSEVRYVTQLTFICN